MDPNPCSVTRVGRRSQPAGPAAQQVEAPLPAAGQDHLVSVDGLTTGEAGNRTQAALDALRGR